MTGCVFARKATVGLNAALRVVNWSPFQSLVWAAVGLNAKHTNC